MKDTLLEIIDLNKYFSIRGNIIDILRFKTSKKIKVIDNINLKLSKGEILVVAGESGSGKTTLAIHAIASVQRAGGIAAIIDAEHAFDRAIFRIHRGRHLADGFALLVIDAA